MTLNSRIAELQRKHMSLSQAVEIAQKSPASDQFHVAELKKKKPNWRTIRQIIADSNVSDFEGFYRYLYDKSSEYAPGKEGMIAYYIHEYSYQSNFRIDKEVNCMALLSKIIETIKPNII